VDSYTAEIINGHTQQGMYFYGHRNLESGDLFLTMSSEPPPILRLQPDMPADTGPVGRRWP
jgi:hypothetical protein